MPEWHSGERVNVRGATWTVLKWTSFSDCIALNLTALHGALATTLLLPFDRPRRTIPPRLRVVSPRRWAHATRELVASSYPYGGLRFCPAGIELLPYQLEPALAALRHGALRLLIADGVGLGKTIEAGLIVREVMKSNQLARVLVLCPASLRDQWARELEGRLQVAPDAADAAWLRRAVRDLPLDVNPWSLPGLYLASMDFIKRPEALVPLEGVRWDLLVVDEAHNATAGTDRRSAIDALACRARRVVLLTATPHPGDDEQFGALCELGRTPDSPPIVVFCRSAAEVASSRRAMKSTLLLVRPTAAEERMHGLLESYTGRIWAEAHARGDPAGELVATVLRKRALSSAAALEVSIRRRAAILSGAASAPSQLTLPWTDSEKDAEPDAILGAAALDDPDTERTALLAIADAAAQAVAAGESKLLALLRLLRRAAQPAIVFSEYRDTVARICAHLAASGHRACVLHGGLSPAERLRSLELFAAGEVLLVATDAASEGLNLHHSCRLVVHFELPWTPLRLQQRAGRLERIGQRRRVHEIALVGRHTAEHLVLAPLMRRAARAQKFGSAGVARQLAERRVVERILAGASDNLDDVPSTRTSQFELRDLRSEAEEETARIRRQRALAGYAEQSSVASARRSHCLPVARRRNRFGENRLIIVAAVALRDAHGDPFEEAVVALSVPGGTPGRSGSSRRVLADARRSLEAFAPAIQSTLTSLINTRLAEVEAVWRKALSAVRMRNAALSRDLRSTAQQLVQSGLFDRRALKSRALRLRASEVLADDLNAEVCLDPGPDTTASGTFEIRAVLLESRRL